MHDNRHRGLTRRWSPSTTVAMAWASCGHGTVSRMKTPLIAALLAAALASGPVYAGVLYKSISPTGVVQFSDTPPADNAVIVETRSIGRRAPASDGLPQVVDRALLVDADGALARANEQVDQAEHALALARRSMWSQLEGLRLTSTRSTASEVERVEFYKRGVLLARQNLLDVLRQRTTAPVQVASR
jgi:hypothetical protein